MRCREILGEGSVSFREREQLRVEGPAGGSWSATSGGDERWGLRVRVALARRFGNVVTLINARSVPVAHRCSRARKPDERSGSTLEVIGVRHRQALMILGRLRGCVCSRGGTPTAPPVIDGNFSVRMSIKSSPNPVHGGRVCAHRPRGDGGGPRGARDEHARTPGRCSCRCSCRFPKLGGEQSGTRACTVA